jgi:hypothetical protein
MESEDNKADKSGDDMLTEMQERLAKDRARLNFSIGKAVLDGHVQRLSTRLDVQERGVQTCVLCILTIYHCNGVQLAVCT